MTETSSEPFTFTSGGDRLVGVLYLPAEQPVAAVVTTGPLTSVKEQATGAYARALAERGFAALAFDHRTYGESEGEPRQFEHPEGKARDISAAVTALAADERTSDLPVVAVGVCVGAGYMARAVADDQRIRSFAGVAGYYSDAAAFARSSPQEYQAAIDRGLAAEQRWRETGQAETIPAVAPDGGDVAMPLREAYEFYGTPAGRSTTTPTASPSSRSRTRHPSTPKRPRPGSGSRSFSCIPSTRSPRPSRGSSTPRCHTQIGAVAGIAGSNRLLRRPPSHRPSADAIAEHYRTTVT